MKSRNFIKSNMLCLNMKRWLVFCFFFKAEHWLNADSRFVFHGVFFGFFSFFYISEQKFFLWRENFKLIFFLNDCNSKKKLFMGTMLEIKCPRICVHL